MATSHHGRRMSGKARTHRFGPARVTKAAERSRRGRPVVEESGIRTAGNLRVEKVEDSFPEKYGQ